MFFTSTHLDTFGGFEEQDLRIAKMRLEDPNRLNKPGLVHFMRCLSAFPVELGQSGTVRRPESCPEEECWPGSFATPTRTAPVICQETKLDPKNVEGESKSEIKSPVG